MFKKYVFFSLDPISLGLFRIALGLILLIDSITKLFWARDFYTDWGILPRWTWITDFMPSWKISFHLASGDTWFQVLLISIQILAALAFMVGWRTRIANLVAFILLCSLQARNTIILSGADDLIRMATFWSLFLPLDQRFALQSSAASSAASRPASFYFAVQLALMYWVTAILKNHPIWLNGEAVYYALNIDMFTTPLATELRKHYELTRYLTWGTLIWEIAGPFLIFFGPLARTLTSLIFIGFHLGLITSLKIGLFPWICIVYWVALIPGEFWAGKLSILVTKLDSGFAWAKTKLRIESPLAETAVTSPGKPWTLYFATFCFSLVCILNIYNINPGQKVPTALKAATNQLFLNQAWDMFAPYPIKNDGWFVISGKFENGESKDLLRNQEVSYEKPNLTSDDYINSQWRKWMLNVWDRGNERILLPYARYLCRKHHQKEGEKSSVRFINIEFMKETTPPPGYIFDKTERISLWSHDCLGK